MKGKIESYSKELIVYNMRRVGISIHMHFMGKGSYRLSKGVIERKIGMLLEEVVAQQASDGRRNYHLNKHTVSLT